MAQEKLKLRAIVTACSLAFASFGGFAVAQETARPGVGTVEVVEVDAEDVRDAAEQVQESLEIIAEMEQEEGLGPLLAGAHGVFLVPDYGRAALGVGARGGEGILMARQDDGTWAGPVFYNFGGVSAGLQAGIEGGHLAFILNNERAVNSFMQENNWSLNADAGLTVVAWSGRGQANAGKGDVTVWSDTAGLFGDLAISLTDINFDEDETAAYYGTQVALAEVFDGRVINPHASALRQALTAATAGTAATATGGTTGGVTTGDTGVIQQNRSTDGGLTSGGVMPERRGEAGEGFVERGTVGEGGVTEGAGVYEQEGVIERGAETTGGVLQEGATEVERGAEATGGTLERGAETTGGMIQEGVEETGQAIERGAEATGNVIQEGAAETEQAIEGEEEGAVRVRPSTGY